MKKQILIAVVVVAGLLAAYVFLTKEEPEKDPGATWELPELSTFDRIDVRRGDVDMVVEKSGEGWRIREPVAFAASQAQMDRVAELFADAENRIVVDDEREATPNNLIRYGFDDDDVIRITLYDGGREAATLDVANTEEVSSGATRTWVRPDGSEALYRVNRDLRGVLDSDLTEWRNTDILVLDDDQRATLTAVEIAYGDDRIRIEKREPGEGTGEEESEWAMVAPENFPADDRQLSDYIGRIDTLRAQDFADDVTPEAAGVTTPVTTVAVWLGDEQRTLRFGSNFFTGGETAQEGSGEGTGEASEPGEERRYVQLDDGPIYQISESDARAFMRQTGDFRNRNVLDLDRDAIVRIELQDPDQPAIVLVKNPIPEGAEADAEATWAMESPEAIPEVEMAQMRRILSNVAEVQAQRFNDEVTDEVAGLATPRRTVTITLSDETTHTLQVGGPVRPPDADAEDAFGVDYFVRADGGLIFELRGFKARNLLRSVDELRPAAPEEEAPPG